MSNTNNSQNDAPELESQLDVCGVVCARRTSGYSSDRPRESSCGCPANRIPARIRDSNVSRALAAGRVIRRRSQSNTHDKINRPINVQESVDEVSFHCRRHCRCCRGNIPVATLSVGIRRCDQPASGCSIFHLHHAYLLTERKTKPIVTKTHGGRGWTSAAGAITVRSRSWTRIHQIRLTLDHGHQDRHSSTRLVDTEQRFL